jgi:hypothetical protein
MSFVNAWSRRIGAAGIGLLILGLAVGGCARRDADKALAASQKAVDGLAPEVQQFLGPEYEQLQKTYEAARQSFSDGKFKIAIEQAQHATAMAESLSAQVETKRAEYKKEWEGLEATIPAALTGLTSRAEEATKKLPAGVTAEALADAKADLEKLPKHWAQASSLAQSGQLVDAVLIGRELKTQCERLSAALGLTSMNPAATSAPAGAPAAGSAPAGSHP